MSLNLKKTLSTTGYLILGAVFVFSIVYSYSFSKAEVAAQGAPPGTVPLKGWGHSEGVGWIRFDPQLPPNNGCPTCGGVYVEPTTGADGNIKGYAWVNPADDNVLPSEQNIGYIKMDPPGPYPTGPGTVSFPSRLVSNNLEGWARACAVFTDGCATMSNANLKPQSERGGWDGWISLRGTNYGVLRNLNKLEGYAWGSDVFGWIKFDPGICDTNGNGYIDAGETTVCGGVTIEGFQYTLGAVPTDATAPNFPPATPIHVLITLRPVVGTPETVNLSITGAPGIPAVPPCMAADFSGGTDCVRNVTIPSLPVGPYILTVRAVSTAPEKTIDIPITVDNLSPTVALRGNGADGILTVTKGQAVRLTWRSTANPGITSNGCRLYAGGATPGAWSLDAGISAEQEFLTPSIFVSTTYRIECRYSGTQGTQDNGNGGTIFDTIIINPRQGGFEEI